MMNTAWKSSPGSTLISCIAPGRAIEAAVMEVKLMGAMKIPPSTVEAAVRVRKRHITPGDAAQVVRHVTAEGRPYSRNIPSAMLGEGCDQH